MKQGIKIEYKKAAIFKNPKEEEKKKQTFH